MSTAANKATFRRTIDAFNQRNLALVAELFAPDYVYHSAPVGTPSGPAGVQHLWQDLFAAFPDITTTIEDQVAEGDKVVSRSLNRFTHTTAFMGVPPTGKLVAFSVIELARFANGQWVESWSVADTLGMLQQLGAVPTPARAQP